MTAIVLFHPGSTSSPKSSNIRGNMVRSRATFTIGKQSSWSPTSHNLLDLANLLPEGELVNARLQDHLYDRKFISHKNWSAKAALKFSAFRFNYYTQNKWYKSLCEKILHLLRVPIDQTLGPASAQNLLIVRKAK